jgi:hypothetical protein|tara:strand:- start:495 stop:731 length:237 start_codon:yes stop_codon:yes gene_type:complete
MKLNFKDILNAVNKIEQSRGHYGENYDCLKLCEKYESPACVADPALTPASAIRIYSVEREYDGTFTVNIPDSHFKANK